MEIIYFAYGMSCMFYGLMAYHFLRCRDQRVQRMAGITMLVLLLQCFKDLLVLQTSWGSSRFADQLTTAIDTMTLPFYIAILVELCRPGVPKPRTFLLHLIPFGVLVSIFAICPADLVFRILSGGAAAYCSWEFQDAQGQKITAGANTKKEWKDLKAGDKLTQRITLSMTGENAMKLKQLYFKE